MPEIKIQYNKSTFEQYDPSSVTVVYSDSGEKVLSKNERCEFIKLAIDRLFSMLIDEVGE